MTNISIRQAQSVDAAEAGAAGYASWCKGIAPLVPQGSHELVSQAVFASFLEENVDQILVAEIGGRIAGIGATEDGDNYISDLWVLPECEGLGVGSALVRALENRIAAHGHETVEIEVMTANTRALGLYSYLDYTIVWQGERTDDVLQVPLHKTLLRKTL